MSSYPEEQRSSSNKTVIIVVSIVAGAILLIVGLCAGFGYMIVQMIKPAVAQMTKIVEDMQAVIMVGQQFLNHLTADQPDAAYELTSDKYKKAKSLKEFKDMLAKHAAIVNSSVSQLNPQPGGNSTMMPFTLTGPKGTVSGTLHLVKEGEQWKVDQISLPQ
jgi:predicted PurR-regulated permease PerM